MLGFRLRSLFTSRWMALLWAILVILTAIQYVGVSDDDAQQGDDAANAQAVSVQGRSTQERDAINAVF